MNVLLHPARRLRARLVRAAVAAAPVLACAAPAFAQSPQPGGPPSSTWGLGLGIASKQKPYRGFDRETRALPMIQYENRWIRVMGPGIEVKLPGLDLGDTGSLDFSLVGRADMGGYEASDSPFLAGMAERKGGFWAGAKLKWENGFADLSLQWTADAAGNSKGRQFSLGLERKFRMGQRWMLVPAVTATWQDDKYVDYYYGVRAAEARTGRPAFRGESSVSTEVGLRGIYMVDREQSVIVGLSATRLGSEIRKSPLVGRSSENGIFLGYVYRFQ